MPKKNQTAVPDADNPEWSAEDFAAAKPLSAYPELQSAMRRARGRPALPPQDRKQKVNIRLSPDVLSALRASGQGWQTRADALLRRALGL